VTTDAGNLPNLESFLRPLRQVYWVRYTSQINRGGVQALQVVIAEAGSERDILSNEQQFRVDIQPPNPMFLTPPGVIERSYTSNKRDAVAEPLLQELRIMVDFPDGHPRDLRSVALLVDGVEVTRLVSAPFDVLTWDLSDYDASAEHALQLEVEDELGLRQTSLEFPVEVVVESPRGAFSLQNIDPQRMMIAGAIALAALALGAVLWIGGRRGVLSRVRSQRRALQDPVTQPVVIQQEQARLRPASQEHPSWPRPAALPKSPAWLAPLADESQADTAGAKIPIQRREMTIGSSPRQATCVINLPSVDQLHARIYQPREGEFYLADAGSVAGTWVNYNPAPPSGIRLKHGDLISIGQVTFRFELARPGRVAKARVSEYKEEE